MVGPVHDDDPARVPELLASADRNLLRLAREHGLRSIAFPCISTGFYRYPPEGAHLIAVDAVRADLEWHGGLDQVVFCAFARSDLESDENALTRNGFSPRNGSRADVDKSRILSKLYS